MLVQQHVPQACSSSRHTGHWTNGAALAGTSISDGKTTRGLVRSTSAMATQQDVLGGIDAGGEIRRPPLVGMQFLHESAVRPGDVLRARPGLNAKDLISFLFSHFATARRPAPAPRCRITLRVLTPAGIPAVKISCK